MHEHISVLLKESIEALNVKKNGKYIDATLGAGGHSKAILELGGEVLGIEADSKMISVADERLKPYCPTLVQGNFSHIAEIAREKNFLPVDGVLFDLGISNLHYEDLGRGFSFRKIDEPLDMRLSTDQGIKAADLLNTLSEAQLTDLFELTLSRGEAKSIARRVLFARNSKPIHLVSDLISIVSPNPEMFLALRMAVNSEIPTLMQGLVGAWSVLAKGGKLVVISFHSGEDRIVKEFMRSHGKLEKPISPSREEILKNSKSRSAKLRICEK